MELTESQLTELFLISRKLTATLRCYIRLIDVLPNKELCIVAQPREFVGQRIIIYIDPSGDITYV